MHQYQLFPFFYLISIINYITLFLKNKANYKLNVKAIIRKMKSFKTYDKISLRCNMNCVVFKLSENLQKKFIKFYEPFKCEKNPPYSIFQAKNYDVTITLYESGKVMFQGIGADIESSIWIDAEKRLNGKTINIEDKPKKEKDKKESEFFLNSYFINKQGSTLFTDRVVKDLNLI